MGSKAYCQQPFDQTRLYLLLHSWSQPACGLSCSSLPLSRPRGQLCRAVSHILLLGLASSSPGAQWHCQPHSCSPSAGRSLLQTSQAPSAPLGAPYVTRSWHKGGVSAFFSGKKTHLIWLLGGVSRKKTKDAQDFKCLV